MKDSSELKQLLEWQEQRWGPDHPKLIASLEAMADLLQMQSRMVEAEPLYWQILEKKHKLYGANDLRVADTIYDLACLHEQQENWVECERLYKWTCDIRCRLLPEGDIQLDESVAKVREIANKRGHDLDESEFLAAKEAASFQSSSKFDWTFYLEKIRLFIVEQNFDIAENMLKCLIDVSQSFEPETRSHAECQHLYGRVLFHKKRLKEALASYEAALALYEKVAGSASAETALCLEDMADLHCKMKEAPQAEFLFKWAIQILGSAAENEQQAKRVNAKLESIDALCQSQDDEKEDWELSKEANEAVKAAQEAQAQAALSGESANKAEADAEAAPQTQDQVADFLWNQYISTARKALEKSDFVGAEMMISRAMEKANEFGVQDQRLWQTLCDSARVHLAQNKTVRAEALYKSAQQLCEKTHGPMHQANAKYWEQLGQMYESLGDKPQAVFCFDKLVTIMVKSNRPLVEYGAYLKKLERLHEKAPASFFD